MYEQGFNGVYSLEAQLKELWKCQLESQAQALPNGWIS